MTAAARRRRQTVTPKKKGRTSMGVGALLALPAAVQGGSGGDASMTSGGSKPSSQGKAQRVSATGVDAPLSSPLGSAEPIVVSAAKRKASAPPVAEPAGSKRGKKVAAPAAAPTPAAAAAGRGKGKKAATPVVEEEGEEEDEDEDPPCGPCGKYATPRNPCVICDGCEGWFHIKCVGFKDVSAVPEGDWYCGPCEAGRGGKGKAAVAAPVEVAATAAGSKRSAKAAAIIEAAPEPKRTKRGSAVVEEAAAPSPAPSDAAAPTAWSEMKVPELRAACEAAGLDTMGVKKALRDRLEAAAEAASKKGKRGRK
jgi:hypothetical protein